MKACKDYNRLINNTRKAWKKARWKKREKRMFDRFYTRVLKGDL